MGMFEDSYKQLNEQQRRAVDTIDGPVMVVAGPGTGKTQLLSMRVANILRQTDTDPTAILCLTFTNKAAINMRDRLIALTGGEARNVMVKTFHSFAAEIMNMYPDYFWNGARLTTAPDSVQLEIIQDILSRLPLGNPLALKFAGTFTAGDDVKKGLRLVKEAGLTPDKLEALIKANIAYIDIVEPKIIDALSTTLSIKRLPELQATIQQLPEQGIDASMAPLLSLTEVLQDGLSNAIEQDLVLEKTTNTGKWKKRFLQSIEGKKGMFDERKRNEWWLSLAGVYRTYRQVLHERGYYDYSDMIVEVISQLEKHADMRADVQERFLYVLIDEFQDTNAAQLRLAHLVSDHFTADSKPNLMAVGDDDQSIYKFNGAELNNMLSFQRSYPATTLVVLEDNYRSSQAILDAAGHIIEKAEDRLVTREPSITKNLIAQNQPKEKGTIIHRSFVTQEEELTGIADDITRDYKAGQYSVAVLARGHSSLRKLSSLLLAREVPVAYEQQSNILDHQAVIQTYLVASLLLSIRAGDINSSNVILAQTLRHPMWQLDPKTLWGIATSNYSKPNWLQFMLESTDENIKNIAEWLVWLANESANEKLPVTIEYILGLRAGQHLTSPLREYFAGKKTVDTDYMHALSAIRLLQSMVSEFARLSSTTLEDFVAFIQLAIDTNEIIADESSFVSGDNAVELLTVHKAKGLEFDTVYVVDAIDNNWKPGAGGRKPPANLPLQPPGDDADDYARLMYVAATRAKRSLIITSYREDTNAKDVMASPLLHEVMPVEETSQVTTSKAIKVLEDHLAWPHLNVADERLNLKRQIENYSLSATGLLDFLDVTKGGPDYFFERHLLRLPQSKTANMAFGIAMHAALELAQILTNSGTMSIPKVLKRYEIVLTEQHLPHQDYDRYLPHGQELLEKLLKSDTFWLPKNSLPEQHINDVTVGGATIKGTVDRIDSKDGELVIVDYKTGKPLSSFTTKDQTKAVKAWRHRTQLTFYALLAGQSGRFKASKTIKGQMIYLEASTPRELIREFIPSPQDIERLSQIIEAVWPRIQTLNLPDTSNYDDSNGGIAQFEQDLIDGVI